MKAITGNSGYSFGSENDDVVDLRSSKTVADASATQTHREVNLRLRPGRPITITIQCGDAENLPRYSVAEQAAVLEALRGTVDQGWLEAKGRQLIGRVLGEDPEYDPKTRPLTVSDYLGELGVKSDEVRKVAGMFGKRLKALFIERHGIEPPVIRDLVGRRIVPVCQYQEQHRDLFDEVWRSLEVRRGKTNRPPNRQ